MGNDTGDLLVVLTWDLTNNLYKLPLNISEIMCSGLQGKIIFPGPVNPKLAVNAKASKLLLFLKTTLKRVRIGVLRAERIVFFMSNILELGKASIYIHVVQTYI